MYRRDFGILLIALFAIYWSLKREGTYKYHKAFYFKLPPDSELEEAPHPLPAPVVADLNGDGTPEILVVTDDLELRVLSPAPHTAHGDGFARAAARGTSHVDIPPALLGSRRPVALAAGYLDPPERDVAGLKPRKMAVAVVTAGWIVTVLDHNLKVLWQKSMRADFPHHVTMREVAVHLSPHRVKDRDRGLVVVAASFHPGDVSPGGGAFGVDGRATGGGDAGGSSGGRDVFDEEIRMEEAERTHAHRSRGSHPGATVPATAPGTLGAASPPGTREWDGGRTMDFSETDRRMSHSLRWHAFEGGRGGERWYTGNSTDRSWYYDIRTLSQDMVPQHNYRLEAIEESMPRFGEVSCRLYRDAVLRTLPHAWSRGADTHIRAAHFAKHRDARGAAKSALAGGGGVAGGAGGRGGRSRGATPPVPQGGHPIHEHAGSAHHVRSANVLVGHSAKGLEVIELYSGKPVCTLELRPHALHVDLNGDGVLDEVFAVGDDAHLHHGHAISGGAPAPCHYYAYSGYPTHTALWNGTFCRGAASSGAIAAALRGVALNLGGARTEAPAPVALPLHSGGAPGHALTVFLNNRGELTAVGAGGARRWSRQTAASWANLERDAAHARVVPSLLPLPLHRHALPSAVLAAGTHSAVLVDTRGDILDTLELPEAPVAHLLRCDFSGGGLTDILAVTRGHVYGYQLVRHLGAGAPYATMLAALLIAVVVVYVTQQGPAASLKTRSTDRID